jgi:hypothetical protein
VVRWPASAAAAPQIDFKLNLKFAKKAEYQIIEELNVSL